MSETYQDWVSRVAAGRDAKPLEQGEVVQAPAGEPFGAIEFVRLERAHYIGEVGKKGDDYVYHFFPKKEFSDFEDRLGDAFLSVFKLPERVQAVFTEEFGSWAVRASGYANNPMTDELALRVFDVLDQKLE